MVVVVVVTNTVVAVSGDGMVVVLVDKDRRKGSASRRMGFQWKGEHGGRRRYLGG